MIAEFDSPEIQLTRPTPIYLQTAELLREKITSGTWPHGTRLPSESELARRLNINHQTLRKSLKILVQENLLAQHHGIGTFVMYHPVPARRRIGVIGVNHQTLNNDFYAWQTIAGLSGAIQNAETVLSFIQTRERTHDEVLAAMHSSGCDGFFVLDRDMDFAATLCRPMFERIPMVFVSNSAPELEEAGKICVDLSPDQAALAIDHLYRLGHRRIAYIGARENQYHLTQRNRIFLERAKEYGLELRQNDFFLAEYIDFQEARKHAAMLCSGTDRPSAIVCPGAPLAYGAWQGVMDAKLRIPDDVSLIGFDCNDRYNPLLSTVLQPISQMAEKAMELLETLIATGARPPRTTFQFDAQVIERGSCRKFNQ